MSVLPAFLRLSRRLSAGMLALALAAGLAAASAPAMAQDTPELRALSQKIERLQRELNTLQRAFYRGESPAPAEPTSSDGAQSDGDDYLSLAAGIRLQSHMTELEQQLQDLTGTVEETRFQVRQLSDRMDKLVTDVDYRLRRIEERLDRGADGPGPQVSESQGDTGSGQPSGDATQQTAAAAESRETGGGRSLGQVSVEAVEAIREQQQTDDGAGAGEGGRQPGDTQTAARPSGDSALPEGGPDEQYEYAFSLLRQADYAAAEQALRAFVAQHPQHDLAGNAQYWLGETYYVRNDYERAAVAFAEGFQSYPDSGKAPDNLLKLGMSLAAIDRKEDACGIFAELLERYPDAAKTIRQRAQREQQQLGCQD